MSSLFAVPVSVMAGVAVADPVAVEDDDDDDEKGVEDGAFEKSLSLKKSAFQSSEAQPAPSVVDALEVVGAVVPNASFPQSSFPQPPLVLPLPSSIPLSPSNPFASSRSSTSTPSSTSSFFFFFFFFFLSFFSFFDFLDFFLPLPPVPSSFVAPPTDAYIPFCLHTATSGGS